MNNRHLYILCGVLALLGTGVTAYRLFELGFPALPDQTTETWRIEARVAFEAQNRPVKVRLLIPRSSEAFTVVTESFIAPGYGVAAAVPPDNRVATFSRARADGPQAVYYSAVVHRAGTPDAGSEDLEPAL